MKKYKKQLVTSDECNNHLSSECYIRRKLQKVCIDSFRNDQHDKFNNKQNVTVDSQELHGTEEENHWMESVDPYIEKNMYKTKYEENQLKIYREYHRLLFVYFRQFHFATDLSRIERQDFILL